MNQEREKAVARIGEPVGQAMTPMDMVSQAVTQGASIEVLERLMALQERWEAGQARRAYEDAIAKAKAEIPPIAKNKAVDFTSARGRTNYKYESLDEVVRTIQPILAKHSLDARFHSVVEGGVVTVTCRISHKDGYGEETSLPGPIDLTGNKNAIQAIGSTATYLQRYTLKLALGLAAAEDDDGRAVSEAAAAGPISEAQMQVLRELADKVGADIPRFCRYLKVNSIADIPASKFEAGMAALRAKEAKQ